jgi:hypothetical protein
MLKMLKGLTNLFKKGTASEGGDPVSTVAQEAGETIRSFSKRGNASSNHAADMLSDSRLSKSIRPITIIWILTLFTACLVANWCGLKTDDQYQELIFWALLCVLGFYFPGRDLVKTFAKRHK